jgi:hypothetical protein
MHGLPIQAKRRQAARELDMGEFARFVAAEDAAHIAGVEPRCLRKVLARNATLS